MQSLKCSCYFKAICRLPLNDVLSVCWFFKLLAPQKHLIRVYNKRHNQVVISTSSFFGLIDQPGKSNLEFGNVFI